MVLINGGHGTNIAVESRGGDSYIWSNYQVLDASGNPYSGELVCYKYVGGTTLTATSSALTRFPQLSKSIYINPSIDNENDLLALRQNPGNSGSYIEVYDLSSFKAGNKTLLNKVNIPSAYWTPYQGFAIDGDSIYWLHGESGKVTTFLCLSVKDNNVKYAKVATVGVQMSDYEGDYREPEGVFPYTDGVTGAKKLLLGISTGEVGNRIATIYAYHSSESFQAQTPIIRYPLISNDTVKSPANNIYQPYMLPLTIQFNGTKWVETTGRFSSINNVVIKSIAIDSSNNLVVTLNERYFGLLYVDVQEDVNLVSKDVRVGVPFYAGGGDSNIVNLSFYKNGTKVSPTDGIPTNSRLGILIMAVDKIES
jgi:hypothetical protein